MAKTILQINYKFNSSFADFNALVTPMASALAAILGLVWKVWLLNEADHEAGGIYLFESHEAAQEFVNSPAVKGFVAQPSLGAFSVKMFGVDEAHSKVIRTPLAIPMAA